MRGRTRSHKKRQTPTGNFQQGFRAPLLTQRYRAGNSENCSFAVRKLEAIPPATSANSSNCSALGSSTNCSFAVDRLEEMVPVAAIKSSSCTPVGSSESCSLMVAIDNMLFEHSARPLAQQFAVSPDTMRIRLEGMQLLYRRKVKYLLLFSAGMRTNLFGGSLFSVQRTWTLLAFWSRRT